MTAPNAGSADLRRIAENLAYASGDGIAKVAANVVRKYAEATRASAQSFAPVRTGTLRDSITVRYESPTHAEVGPEVPYGVYQEFGTKGPYEIKPKNVNGVLVFNIGGKRVFAKRVTHPGVKAHPYMRPGLEAAIGTEMAHEMAREGTLIITKGKAAS